MTLATTMKFYLGTHQPHWLGDPRFTGVPLFISRHRDAELTAARSASERLGITGATIATGREGET